jgi:hypothetical protein
MLVRLQVVVGLLKAMFTTCRNCPSPPEALCTLLLFGFLWGSTFLLAVPVLFVLKYVGSASSGDLVTSSPVCSADCVALVLAASCHRAAV